MQACQPAKECFQRSSSSTVCSYNSAPFVRQLLVIFVNQGEQRQHQRLPRERPERPGLANRFVEVGCHRYSLLRRYRPSAQYTWTVLGDIGVPTLDIGLDLLPGKRGQFSRRKPFRQAPARIVPIGIGAARHDDAAVGKNGRPNFR